MNRCQPCMTLRTIIKLLWKNYVVDATKNFKREYNSYSMISLVSCSLDNPSLGQVPLIDKNECADIKTIRAVAAKNFEKVDKKHMYENWSSQMYQLLYKDDEENS